jgi:hypothetical protein
MSAALSAGTKIPSGPFREMEDILKAMASGGCCLTGQVVITATFTPRNKISVHLRSTCPFAKAGYRNLKIINFKVIPA